MSRKYGSWQRWFIRCSSQYWATKCLKKGCKRHRGRKAARGRAGTNATIHVNGSGPVAVHALPPPQHAPNSTKRKYDDIDLGFSVGPPAPQMSYERSRPQTPAVTPSRELPQQHGLPNISPSLQHDGLTLPNRSRGASRVHSRGPTGRTHLTLDIPYRQHRQIYSWSLATHPIFRNNYGRTFSRISCSPTVP